MSAFLPTLYADANIFSAQYYQGGITTLAIRRIKTAEWWEFERHRYSLFASKFIETELRAGRYPGQQSAIKAVRRLPYLQPTALVDECVTALIENKIVPESEYGDALHLAYALAYRIDYLLTWNHAHLANPMIWRQLESLARKLRLRSPLIVSPETIPWESMGHRIGRRDEK